MKTPKQVISGIHWNARQKTEYIESHINDNIRNALYKEFEKKHPSPPHYIINTTEYRNWIADRNTYVEQNFHPVTIASDDKEKLAKNFRTQSYSDIIRRGLTTLLVVAPLIFSAGSCNSCVMSPEYDALMRQSNVQGSLDNRIRIARSFINREESDSIYSVLYGATPDEISIMNKRLTKLENYRDSVINNPKYIKTEEASGARTRKGLYQILSGIAASIGVGLLSFGAGRLTKKKREKKNKEITLKYFPVIGGSASI